MFLPSQGEEGISALHQITAEERVWVTSDVIYNQVGIVQLNHKEDLHTGHGYRHAHTPTQHSGSVRIFNFNRPTNIHTYVHMVLDTDNLQFFDEFLDFMVQFSDELDFTEQANADIHGDVFGFSARFCAEEI